jgi:glycosyltransferase involved in cell wall biosynthesis
MTRHKIVLQTNSPAMKTGLAENGRALFNYLAKRGKYDLVYYGSQTADNDPVLARLPYKAYGAVPSNQAVLQRWANDPYMMRQVYYGSHYIDQIVRDEKPSIWVGSDDAWAFHDAYFKSEWFKRINSIFHITVDSVPVAPLAYEQAKATKHFFTWAEFGAKEMRRQGAEYAHVDSIYGASDTTKFRPVTSAERAELRRQMGLDPNDLIFLFVGRNQLRKELISVLEGFAQFKRTHPELRAKLFFHTAWFDSPQGWDIPRLRDYLGIKREDVLCTYYCGNCGRWEVKPYDGEGKNCRFCGKEKSVGTIDGYRSGVADDEMFLIYGLADASISAITSGGLEFHNVQSLLCGLPLATTNYSSGEDFCTQPFVHPITWHSRYEHQSSFRKASNDPASIADFITTVCNMSPSARQAIGEQGRDWATKTFSIETIGAKWEAVFDAMPFPDWSSITIEYKPKNETAPMPEIADPAAWVKALYNQILLVEPDPDGFKHWMTSLERGVPRSDIYQYFLMRAREDNKEHAAPKDFWELIDRKSGKKRALCVIRESIGDCIILTQLFESFHQQYPEHDLYVATQPQYFEVFAGNPHVKAVIPYLAPMENELQMTGTGQEEGYFDVYFHPAIPTQRHLDYISSHSIAYDLNVKTQEVCS